MRAGFAENILAVIACALHHLDSLLGGHMNYIQRCAGHVREHDRPIGGFGFGLPRASQGVIHRVGVTGSECLTDQYVYGRAIFCMHHDHGTDVCSSLHRAHDLAVITKEDTGIGHEQFETGDALID